MKCETCQEEATVHVETIGCNFCELCVKKIDQRIKEMNMAKPCENCGGLGHVDSGGFSPWGEPINLPCPACAGNWLELASWGAAWKRDSSLEKWFPLTAEELAKLRALNEDKAKTIAAYCRMASLDKWRVRKLTDAIDRYLSADGYRDASAILTQARADAVNAKPQHHIPAAPFVDADLDEKRAPTGPLKQYALHVPDDDVDREYCTGYNHGLVLAEAYIEERKVAQMKTYTIEDFKRWGAQRRKEIQARTHQQKSQRDGPRP